MQAVELRHLRCLVAIAEERSFSRAAHRLGTTQPAISQLLKRLEDLLGHRLVERDRSSVSLTPIGEEVLPSMRQALAAVDQALEATRRSLRGETGRLRVGLSAPSLYGGVPGMIRRFRAQRPQVEIEMQVSPSADQAAALLEGRLDVAFSAFAHQQSALVWEQVGEEALCVVLPRWHRLAGSRAISFAQLRGEPWILPPASTPLREEILAQCRATGFEARVAAESADFATTMGLVLAGSGVALAAESFGGFAGPELMLAPLTGTALRLRHYLTYRKAETAPAVLAFLRMVSEERVAWSGLPPEDPGGDHDAEGDDGDAQHGG